ncbi:MAG: hypothetical protein ACMXYC_01965 [Candidatus Woesearchaeota archaeon]
MEFDYRAIHFERESLLIPLQDRITICPYLSIDQIYFWARKMQSFLKKDSYKIQSDDKRVYIKDKQNKVIYTLKTLHQDDRTFPDTLIIQPTSDKQVDQNKELEQLVKFYHTLVNR